MNLTDAKDGLRSWRSIWLITSAVKLKSSVQNGIGPEADILPQIPKPSEIGLIHWIRFRFPTQTGNIEDAFVCASDLANQFADHLSLATFSKVDVLRHIATVPGERISSAFKILATEIVGDVEYSQTASALGAVSEFAGEQTTSALRQFRRAMNTTVRSEALLLFYRAIETLSISEAEPNIKACKKCGHEQIVGRKTKVKIVESLTANGLPRDIAKEFVDLRNTVAHGAAGHSLASEERFEFLYAKVAPVVAKILRHKSGIERICDENIVIRKPYVIYDCEYDSNANLIVGIKPTFEAESILMTVGDCPESAPLQIRVKLGISEKLMTPDHLQYLAPWIVPALKSETE